MIKHDHRGRLRGRLGRVRIEGFGGSTPGASPPPPIVFSQVRGGRRVGGGHGEISPAFPLPPRMIMGATGPETDAIGCGARAACVRHACGKMRHACGMRAATRAARRCGACDTEAPVKITTKIIIGAVAAIMLLWMGGHQGLAVMIGIIGAVAFILDMSSFDTIKCGCDHGKIWSWFGTRFKRCKRCDGTGIRKGFLHRGD